MTTEQCLPTQQYVHLPALGLWALALFSIASCARLEQPPAEQTEGLAPSCIEDCEDAATMECVPGSVRCLDETAQTCSDQGALETEDCAAQGLTCSAGLGCTRCRAGEARCQGDASQVCAPDGSGYGQPQACDAARGLSCDVRSGICRDLCAAAEADDSYLGCEYWPTVTCNPVDDEFSFAVVISNPQLTAASVVVQRGSQTIAEVTVGAGALETIELPWVAPLLRAGRGQSRLVRAGAYRLTSSVPVAVYQFSPLRYRLPHDCADESERKLGDDQCFSFTNDASLLLPTHILSGDYIAVSRPTRQVLTRYLNEEGEDYLFDSDFNRSESWGTSPGFVTLVGVEDRPVQVEIELSAGIEGGSIDEGSDVPIPAHQRGEVLRVELGRGDVLQVLSRMPEPRGDCSHSPVDRVEIECGPQDNRFACVREYTYCQLGAEYDLTGSRIRADGKLFVLNGHSCAFVPFTSYACDHLEEPAFPVASWGSAYAVAHSQPIDGEPNVVRIVSGADGNHLSFEPPVLPDRSLRRGEVLEFVADRDFHVRGSGGFAVAQFMVGQQYNDPAADSDDGLVGDPSMTFAVPVGQMRTDYHFLAPDTYEQSWITLVAAEGEVWLDGEAVGGFTPIGRSGWRAARVRVAPGAHAINADNPFGVTVYGFGSYTSYMVPGGLNFLPLNEVD